MLQFSSVQSLSYVQLFATPWTASCQASLSITNSRSLLKLMSIESVMPSNHLIPVVPFFSCPQSFPESGSFLKSQFFASGGQGIRASTLAQSYQSIFKIDFFYDWLVWSPCCPRDSQESSLAQFKSINSPVLSLLYGPTLTFMHDYWKNHSFDYLDLCQQSDVSAF